MASSYQYQPLSSPSTQIRLLELLPGRGIIQCQLKVTDLEEAEGTYEPISYCWKAYTRDHWYGTTYREKKKQRTLRMRVDGADFYITENLHGALRQMRLESKVRLLWADAICINQADDEEKSVQVAMMSQIYQGGFQTLAWLGEADHRTRKAFAFLKDCANRASETTSLSSQSEQSETEVSSQFEQSEPEVPSQTEQSEPEVSSQTEQSEPEVSSQSEQSEPEAISRNSERPGFAAICRRRTTWDMFAWESLRASVESIIRRPYFRRTWIIQEIAISKRVLFMCGKFDITWIDLAEGFWEKPFVVLDQDSFIALHYIWTSLYEYDLMEVAMIASPTQASDSRDKLYSVLGLVPDSEMTAAVTVNYNKSPEEVFYDFTKGLLLSSTKLAALSMSYGCSLDKPRHLPSWVWNPQPEEPYVRFSVSHSTLHQYQAARDSKSQPKFRGSMLGLGGIVLQTVTAVGSVCKPESRRHLPFHLDDPREFLRLLLLYFEYRAIGGINDVSIDHTTAEHLRNILFRTTWPYNFSTETPLPASDQLQEARYIEKLTCFDSEVVKHFGKYVSGGKKPMTLWTRFKLLVALETWLIRNIFGDPAAREFEKLVPASSYLGNRRLVRTDEGDIALCPKETAVNDKLVLLQGSDVPFILRPIGEHWQIVGECYAHVLMDGSAWDESRCEMLWIE